MVLSADADAKREPSGDQLHHNTFLVCATRVFKSEYEIVSQTFTVLSSKAEASLLPEGAQLQQ